MDLVNSSLVNSEAPANNGQHEDEVPSSTGSRNSLSGQSQPGRKYYRAMHHRIFVNRSLHLGKIKFFGFDMDYTLAEYKSPDFEALAFNFAVKRLISMGYPNAILDFEYDSHFAVRGLWFDTLNGNLLKVDPYGNILVCVHGFKFLKTSEMYSIYPNKFVQMDDSRIYVLNTLFTQPETYLLACVVDYFSNSPDYVQSTTGVKSTEGSLDMPYKSIFQDVRHAFDWIHAKGSLKQETVNNLEKYVHQTDHLPMLFKRMRENGKIIFLLTNSDYGYTDKIMSYLFDVPSAQKQDWKSFFDYIVVDARKPLFFGEGTILRQVDTMTGALRLGTHKGPFQAGQVYSGGSCDVFTELIEAKGRDVLYVGDHIYGDILKSKKTRGWRTFLVVPELQRELHVWTNKRELFERLQDLDVKLGDLYKHLDSSCKDQPDLGDLRTSIRETIHELDMSYGILGSIFRCGSRQTHIANQICRYADLYGCTCLNLMYYPFTYMFRSPAMLMPHESTVEHDKDRGLNNDEPLLIENIVENGQKSQGGHLLRGTPQGPSHVPHLFAETPTAVTHTHDEDDTDSEHSND